MDFKQSLIRNIITQSKRLKEHFLPIIEKDGEQLKTLRIKKLYQLNQIGKRVYFIIIKNSTKKHELEYYLALSLASQSSDFLVALAKEYAISNSLKVLQYPLVPKSLRINLILLKKIIDFEHYQEIIHLFTEIYNNYRKKIEKIKNLIEIE